MSRKLIGAHVSAAGGLHNAPENAKAIGARAFALFVKNQRQWTAPPVTEAQAEAFRAGCAKLGYAPGAILPHDGYLLNLGHPEKEGWEKSHHAFVDEMARCQTLGLTALNFHPGTTLGKLTPEACLDRVAESINRALDRTQGVVAVIESTAGQGGCVGRTFEELAHLIERIDDKSRAGVCLDTCHMFAAGYDLKTPAAYQKTMAQFEATVGFRYLKGMHLNDCKSEFGSRVDRHAPLGEGTLGLDCFRCIMADPRTDGIPMVLETTDPDRWPEEIALLYRMEEEARG